MKQKERYRAPKYGDRADINVVIDTGDPYQNLANAIVQQAAEDYRAACWYLRKHKKPDMLDYIKPEEAKLLKIGTHYTKQERALRKRAKKKYREEILWETEIARWWRREQIRAIRNSEEWRHYYFAETRRWEAEKTVKECEEFFLGDWIKMLTRLDGAELLQRLREEHGGNTVSQAGQAVG